MARIVADDRGDERHMPPSSNASLVDIFLVQVYFPFSQSLSEPHLSLPFAYLRCDSVCIWEAPLLHSLLHVALEVIDPVEDFKVLLDVRGLCKFVQVSWSTGGTFSLHIFFQRTALAHRVTETPMKWFTDSQGFSAQRMMRVMPSSLRLSRSASSEC